MTLPKQLVALALASIPAAAAAENYLGTLKPPQSSLAAQGLYSFATVANGAFSAPALENGYRLKLGYKYSRYLAVEGEYVDFGRASGLFASPSNLASAFRSTGFGVDTIATLPLWRFSFYGRFGAYRGEARTGFGAYSTSLMSDPAARSTRVRYGLGVRYDFTPSLGVRADVERYTPPGSIFASEAEVADQFSVGVSWRF